MVSKMEAAVPGKNTIEKLEQMNNGDKQAAQLAYLRAHENMLTLNSQNYL